MSSNVPQGVASAAEAVVAATPRAAILVEGRSDEAAVRALAARRGRDLEAEGVAVVALGGATNIGHYVAVLGPRGAGLHLAGLYDEAEAGAVRRGLLASGVAADGDLTVDGFHVCRRDLEDELLRALGVDAVLRILERDGEAARFRTFQRQPAQRGRPIEAHLHRFLGIRSGRKVRYGRLLVEALDLDRVPAPLDAILTEV
ncbi:MAG TPA: TOPRIM nucleotidyl transferase/hydrolase domain-containing protein [Egicoccus sp.]|nr:TOPRIM nucleotidyl transferase/hydrolase domain-containing protein [Egicoccus sp.]HSK24650.1 TOPRIM nucleotidyl transferase/hydrolase domain-containing protein [Egicoccus sp.]